MGGESTDIKEIIAPYFNYYSWLISTCNNRLSKDNQKSSKLYHEYHTHMIEQWGSTGSSFVTVLSNVFYITSYFIFDFGLIFRYGGYNEAVFSTARIIWALDLELWYLSSLKFVITLKFLGSKLFMLKNMLRDLFAFVYMIYITMSAYIVVSRALILYKQVPFTGRRGHFSEILYVPYWFIYGDVSDKYLLDERSLGGSNIISRTITEVTTTHVLLAFHMLFINILLLNLFIAVFADSIAKVQENTEFYWCYQRYSFVREYFERFPLTYSLLIIISQIIFLTLTIRQKCCSKWGRNQVADANQVPLLKKFTRIFKMIPKYKSQNERWDLCENAATYSYVHSILEINKNSDRLTVTHENVTEKVVTIDLNVVKATIDEQQAIESFKNQLMTIFNSVLVENQKAFEQTNSRIDDRFNQMKTSLEWMMDSIAPVKTNEPTHPKLKFQSNSLRNYISYENQATTFSTYSPK
ncbi:unnamed protein product [Rotaria magnacalcarata]|uniref:Ion transport domain-containing protein n=1 Tax=Rotaria magnacalcarata TaxID=392030 RepID=A0A816YS94_9BILA|nr:unnamed protein product [Rotaria magnacalcarata]CAF2166111.1 unnamed protein product [Rotaria magnacalcarata]CAF3958374.1 unnamed protein product [Rotaria magnacalcarata]CAF4020097.1 unnamed protein product [Rotaria magnacalcarata]